VEYFATKNSLWGAILISLFCIVLKKKQAKFIQPGEPSTVRGWGINISEDFMTLDWPLTI
jgi:hypothetical protein